MQRHCGFPPKAAKECGTLIFLVGGKGREIEDQKISKCQRRERKGNDNEQSVILLCLQQKPNGGSNIGHMHGEGKFSKSALKKTKRRDGIQHDENKG